MYSMYSSAASVNPGGVNARDVTAAAPRPLVMAPAAIGIVAPDSSGSGSFKAVAVYSIGTVFASANVKGNTCINIKDCSFPPVCCGISIPGCRRC